MTLSYSFSVLLFVYCVLNGLDGVSSSNVPFPSELVGKNFSRVDAGIRFPIQDQVIISATEIIYFPEFSSVPGPYILNCKEKLSFSINRNSRNVTITKFPVVIENAFDSSGRQNPNLSGGTCESEQDKVKIVYNPTGSTAPMFLNQIKRIVAGLNRIRDGDAPQTLIPAELREVKPPCGENFELEPVIGYVRTVAFENGFCAE